MQYKNIRKNLVLVWIVLTLLTFVSFAENTSEFGKVKLYDHSTEKTDEYIPAHITIGGDDVVTDVPAIIYIEWRDDVQYSRTLVPIRAITEMLGADVSWDGENQTAHVLYEDKDIALKLESKTALVNGKEVPLPSDIPAKLMAYNGNDRTMVPLRFLSEELGLHIAWDNISKEVRLNRPLQRIEKIEYQQNEGAQEFVIETSDKVSYVDYFVDGSEIERRSKLILQLANVVIAEDLLETDENGTYTEIIDDGGIGTFKAQQRIEDDVPELLIEIDMEQARGYDIKEEDNKLTISFVNNIKSITREQLISDEYIMVQAIDEPVYKITEWPEKNKYIIDILGAKLDDIPAGIGEVAINDKGIRKVTYGQLNAKEVYGEEQWITRVVLELEDFNDVEYINIDKTKNQLWINLENQDELQQIDYYSVDKKTSMLRILCENPKDYELDYDKDAHMIEVKIDKDDTNLKPVKFKPYDDKISKIIVDEKKKYYLIEVYLKDGVEYKRDKYDKGISVRIMTKNRIKRPQDGKLLIVIDPGHGGHDPGAISKIDGTEEKDINLTIALRLKKLLESNGLNVYMTRETDEFIGLYTRTDIANELEADAFISIHANSAANFEAYGIETLYGKSPKFAKTIHDNIINKTGTFDRGIKERMDLAVIRTSDMSAILIETGFLSNENDLNNLHDERFIDKLNQGVLNGLLDHFDLE